MSSLDFIIVGSSAILGIAFIYIVWSYAKGLRSSPRELWIMYVIRLLEGAAYFAISFSMALWLSSDCGLGDVEAGVFISIWSVMHGAFLLIAGPFVDVFGIKKSFVFTFVLIIVSRLFVFWLTDPFLSMTLVFVPFAIGAALIEPAGYIAVKRYTTTKGANFGFGLIYVILNIAMAGGIWGFDKAREFFGETAGTVLPVVGHLSTYQLIYFVCLGIAVVCILILWFMRDGVEMGPEGVRVSLPERQLESLATMIVRTLKKAVTEIISTLVSVIKDSYFWKYVLIISITLFVRFTFFHFLYTFPKYGIRVLGEGAKVGTIYGTLNPILIVFAVPLFTALTKNFNSYKMLTIGSAISSLAIFIAAIPGHLFAPLTNTALGELVFVKWLSLAQDMPALLANPPSDFYWPLFMLIIIWSLGEAVWYPRYLHVLTELAPKGKEGTYIAVVTLPTFTSNLVVGPMSGLLLKAYTPLHEIVDAAGKTVQVVGDLSHHYMVWVWIGGMAVLTPIFLTIFKGVYYSMKKEQSKKEEQSEMPDPN
jgi:MFS family permease